MFARLPLVPLPLLLLAAASPALAAAPDNDDFADATSVGEFPYEDAVDTREATSESDEPNWWAFTDGPGPTVWYAYTADADGWAAADSLGSGPTDGCPSADDCYDTTIAVWTLDAAGDFVNVATNDDFEGRLSFVPFGVEAGETYYIQVGTWESRAGGDLAFRVDTYTPPDPYEISATVDDVSANVRTGEVKASGTITCSEAGWFALNLTLGQTVGRFKTRAFAYVSGTCDTSTVDWVASGFGDGVVLGRATYSASVYGSADATGQFGSAWVDGSIVSKGRGAK